MNEIATETSGGVGLITLNRPKALNALSLSMIRDLTAILLAWREDAAIRAVAIRGHGKEGPFGAFSAGGDIRFFHQAIHAGDPQLEDFFTEEYRLNHLIYGYGKPYLTFMDGVVMGGGMGISQGASLRLVTERTKMAMPETNIGLFPDVGGGYFLSRCPGRVGEYLALTGHMIGAADALAAGLADAVVDSGKLPALWTQLQAGDLSWVEGLHDVPSPLPVAPLLAQRDTIDRYFALPTVQEMVSALEADASSWATEAAALLRKRSPLMLHVTLEQLRRGRSMELADNLRMERGLMRHSFHLRPGASETVEGIRALAIDKDQQPRWNPSRIEDVTPEMVQPFFESPWPAHAHPLRHLG